MGQVNPHIQVRGSLCLGHVGHWIKPKKYGSTWLVKLSNITVTGNTNDCSIREY